MCVRVCASTDITSYIRNQKYIYSSILMITNCLKLAFFQYFSNECNFHFLFRPCFFSYYRKPSDVHTYTYQMYWQYISVPSSNLTWGKFHSHPVYTSSALPLPRNSLNRNILKQSSSLFEIFIQLKWSKSPDKSFRASLLIRIFLFSFLSTK